MPKQKRAPWNRALIIPPVVVTWPRPGTRADEALQALLVGPQNQFDFRTGGWRLAANVQKLEDLGWRFVAREIVRPGCRRTIKEYRFDRTDSGTAAALASRQKGVIDATLAGLIEEVRA